MIDAATADTAPRGGDGATGTEDGGVDTGAGAEPGDRWYASDSPWNTPIPPDPALDPSSDDMVRALAEGTRGEGIVIAAGEWTVPVYYADADTPRYDVAMTAGWAPANRLLGVPIPDDAAPDPEGDGHMMIIDRSTRCEYDFWQARKEGGVWSASWGNRIESDGDGFYDQGLSARGSGFALGGGLIRPEELAAGMIAHALHFAFPDPRSGGPVLPATESDGRSDGPGSIPEGARVQLDPGYDVDALPELWQRTVARALQQYGMYLGDVGGVVSLYAQHRDSASTPYPWGDANYVYLPQSLIASLRVLEVGPQYSPTVDLVPSRCGDYE